MNDELSQLEEKYRRKKGSGEWEQYALRCEDPFAEPPWRELAACVAQARATSGIGTVEECARQIFNSDLYHLEFDLHARRQSERYAASEDSIGLNFSQAREVWDPPNDRLRKAFIRYVSELQPGQHHDLAKKEAASHAEETEPAQETTQGIELTRPEPAPEAGSRTVAPVLDAVTEGRSPVEAGANAPAAETAPAEGEPAASTNTSGPAAAEGHGALTANGFPRGGRGRPRLTPNVHPEVEQYLERVGDTARREITISDFCLVSGFRDDTVFGAWRRGDEKRCNSGQAQRFQNTLNLSPEDFLRRLEEKVTRR